MVHQVAAQNGVYSCILLRLLHSKHWSNHLPRSYIWLDNRIRVRDLVVLFLPQLSALVSLAEGEANNPKHETFAGEYRRTDHGQACPTGNHFVRTRLEQFFIDGVANISILLTCQLPSWSDIGPGIWCGSDGAATQRLVCTAESNVNGKKAELCELGLQIKAQRMQALISMDVFGAPLRKRNEWHQLFLQLLSFILPLCKAKVPTPQRGEQ